MSTSEHLKKINLLWNEFVSHGMKDAYTNVEQLSLLLFLKRLDEIQTKKEANAFLFEIEIKDPIFDDEHTDCRWSQFITYDPQMLYNKFQDKILPFIQYNIKETSETVFVKCLRNTQLRFPTPNMLKKAVDCLDSIDTENRLIVHECYSLLVSKLKPDTAKDQYMTPAYLADLCIALTLPGIHDKICDPAVGTGTMLVASANYIRQIYEAELLDADMRFYFNNEMFTGIDYDASMTNISFMNMLMNEVENSHILSMDALSPSNTLTDEFSVILSHIPFSTVVDVNHISESLNYGAQTNHTAVLFFRLIMRMLKSDGRCAIIIPNILLFGVKHAPMEIKEDLLNNHRIEAIISIQDPSLNQLNRLSCSILVFTKDIPDGTDDVWFYKLTSAEQVSDLLYRFRHKEAERTRSRYERSFLVSREEIINNKYMLIMNRYAQNIAQLTTDPLSALQDLLISNNILKNAINQLNDEQ